MTKRITPMNCTQEEYVLHLIKTGKFTEFEIVQAIENSTCTYERGDGSLDSTDIRGKMHRFENLYKAYAKTCRFSHDQILALLRTTAKLEREETFVRMIERGMRLKEMPIVSRWTAQQDYELIELFYSNRSYVTISQIMKRYPDDIKRRLIDILGIYDFTRVIHMNKVFKEYHLRMLQERVEAKETEELYHFLKECGFNG